MLKVTQRVNGGGSGLNQDCLALRGQPPVSAATEQVVWSYPPAQKLQKKDMHMLLSPCHQALAGQHWKWLKTDFTASMEPGKGDRKIKMSTRLKQSRVSQGEACVSQAGEAGMRHEESPTDVTETRQASQWSKEETRGGRDPTWSL